MDVQNVPLEKIRIGEYAQRVEVEDEEIIELAASIRRVGMLVPVVVCRRGDVLVLVAGHRRIAAARSVGLEVVPAVVREDVGAAAKEISFAENMFRKDLSPIELAAAIKDCLDAGTLSVDELAQGLHRSIHWVQRQEALLSWPDDVLEVIHNGNLSVSAASNLAMVEDDVYREFLLRQAVENGATARATAAWLQAWRSMAPASEAVTGEPVPAGERSVPMVPQAPCIVCSNVYRTDELSHVPVCVHCVRTIRNLGDSG
ncbi:Chromosome-partitioning protein Spo0J [subsurface metagenome]